MIIVKLMGGMGNQMFQYAFGRSLAKHLNVPLKLDLSNLQTSASRPEETPRSYELHVFNIEESFATSEEVKEFLVTKPKKFFPKLLFKIKKKIAPKRYYKEKSFSFDPQVFTVKAPVFAEGYWQTEKYFNSVQDIIRKDFQLKGKPTPTIQKSLDDILEHNSISIHVRRGDYITNKSANTFHGTCSLEYYQQAMDYIAGRVSNPTYYVFSDDINWVRENLKITAPHHFIENTADVHASEDIRLMSACKHHIIANSSFSWWGAWLNSRTDKIVVAPKRWFAKEDIDTSDLIPETWIRL